MRKLPLYNPRNRFEDTQVFYEEEHLPDAGYHLHLDKSRTILSHNTSPDIGFTYSVNPYRGCLHGCIYCYARPSHEYLGYGAGTDFERHIFYKPDAAKLLKKAFDKSSWKKELVAFSGVTDCYQPAESTFKLTRGCLEICAEYNNQVGVITKSSLVRRDLDLFQQIRRTASAHLYISIPCLDDEVLRLIEPYAPSATVRLQTIENFAKAGIEVGVSLAPLIPGLTDTSMGQTLKVAREYGATSAFWSLLHLPGSSQTFFEHELRRCLPLKADKIIRRLKETRSGNMNDNRIGFRMKGEGTFATTYQQMFELYRRRYGYMSLSQSDLTKEKRSEKSASHSFRRLEINMKQLKLF